ncbi:MAG: hypothetical protein JWM71_1272, partial [Solirubrobacteraceae bacterium]|nr:hypothetical protein [Solirubrobacteraceae bacterium]
MRRLLAWATSVGLGLSIAAVGLLFLGPAFGFHAWPGHGSPPRAGVSELPAAPLIAAVASKSGRGATSLGARLGRLPATGTAVASTGFSLVGSGPSAVVRGQGTPVRLPAASSPATGNGAPAPAAPVVATPVAPVVTPTPAAPVVAAAPVAA